MTDAPDLGPVLDAVRDAVLDLPDGLTVAARRKLLDARLASIADITSSASKYAELHQDVVDRDAEKLGLAIMRTHVQIAEPDLAKQAAKRKAEALDLDDYVTPAQAAAILATDEATVGRLIEDGQLHVAYAGTLLGRAEVEEVGDRLDEMRAEAEQHAADDDAPRIEIAPGVWAQDSGEPATTGSASTLTVDMTRPMLIDPDCRAGKCGSCVSGPCEHGCHLMAASEDDSAHRELVTGVLGAIAENQAVIEAELHDAHAVGEELVPGEMYFDLHGNRLFAVGGGILGQPVELIRPDGSVVTSAEQVRGPLTRARIVSADAIVLEQPTAGATRDLVRVMPGYGPSAPPVMVLIDGVRRVLLATGCRSCDGTPDASLTRDQARTLATHIALAADDAERSQG